MVNAAQRLQVAKAQALTGKAAVIVLTAQERDQILAAFTLLLDLVHSPKDTP